MANVLVVDGVAMPSPTSLGIKYADIDSPNSGRSDNGYLNRERLRANVTTLSLEWEFLTSAEVAKIVNAISPVSIQVQFSATGGLSRAKTMYSGDKNWSMVYFGGDDSSKSRWNLSVNLIEM